MATYTTGDNKLELMESGGTLRNELEKNNRNMEKIDNKLSGGAWKDVTLAEGWTRHIATDTLQIKDLGYFFILKGRIKALDGVEPTVNMQIFDIGTRLSKICDFTVPNIYGAGSTVGVYIGVSGLARFRYTDPNAKIISLDGIVIPK